MPPWLVALNLALQLAPSVESEIEAAVTEHWGKDHVQQVVQGLGHLNNIINTVASVAEAQATNVKMPDSARPQPQDLSHLDQNTQTEGK